jgi:large subunit ribosomal protein L30
MSRIRTAETAPGGADEGVAETAPVATIRVTYRKSAIGYAQDQKATVAALGLHRLHQTVVHADTPAVRGMVQKVRHLVSVDDVPADSPELAAAAAAGSEVKDASSRRES